MQNIKIEIKSPFNTYRYYIIELSMEESKLKKFSISNKQTKQRD